MTGRSNCSERRSRSFRSAVHAYPFRVRRPVLASSTTGMNRPRIQGLTTGGISDRDSEKKGVVVRPDGYEADRSSGDPAHRMRRMLWTFTSGV